MPVRSRSNVGAVVKQLDDIARRKATEAAVEYERLVQEEMRRPKSGRIYGAEAAVAFKAKGGGEREINFAVTRKKKDGQAVTSTVSFTANRGQKARVNTVKFVANRGKKWREGKRNGGMHRASAPGEAPAIQTGALRKGITHTVVQVAPGRWSTRVGVSTQSGRGGPAKGSSRSIAHMLEWGTSQMEERPAWRPAFERFKTGARAVARRAGKRR
jgi:hypothetical protein